MYKIDEYKKKIANCLKNLKKHALFYNNAGYFDLNKDAEEFYRGLLNLFYDWNLEPLNTIKDPNFKGVDLGDIQQKIVVQVTGEKDSEKIHKSIKGFIDKSLKLGYKTLYILMFKGKSKFPNARFAKTVKRAFVFDKSEHIIDHSDLCTILKDCKFEKLESIYLYLNQTVGFRRSKPIFPSISKKDWWVEPNKFKEIRDDLTRETTHTQLLPIVIHGMTGVGKSILADELACDERVKQKYTHGTLKTKLGQDANQHQLLSSLNDWIKELGRNTVFESIEGAKNQLYKLLRNQKMLLIIDDVWNTEQIRAFPSDMVECRLLFTTRNTEPFKEDFPTLEPYYLLPLDPEQSLLLLNNLECDIQEEQKQLALKLVEEVGRLPLAIKLLASHIKDRIPLEHLLEQLQEESNKLQILKYGDTNLIALFNLSLRKLTEKQKEHFCWLGILAEDTIITSKIAASAWKITEVQASIILRELENRALLMPYSQEKSNKSYVMHDIAHSRAKYLISAPTETQENVDLPGFGLTIEQAHTELLQRYKNKCSEKTLWHTLSDDGYIYNRLIWHMQKATSYQAIHNLLTEQTPEGKNGWYDAHNKIGRRMDYLQNVEQAFRLASLEKNIALEIRYALIIASLHSLSTKIPGQLIKHLVEEKIWDRKQALRYIEFLPHDGIRAEVIANLAGLLPTEKLLIFALNIFDTHLQLQAIEGLASVLSSEQWKEVLENVETNNGEFFIRWLTNVVDYIPLELVLELVPRAQRFPNNEGYHQDRLLGIIASRLAGLDHIDQAISVASSLSFQPYRRVAMVRIIKKIPSSTPTKTKILQEALEEIYINFDGNPKLIAEALSDLAPSFDCLPEEEKEQAVTKAYIAVMRLNLEFSKLEPIMHLMPCLSGTLRQNLLQEVEKMLDSKTSNIYPISNEYAAIVKQLAEFYVKQGDVNKAIEISNRAEEKKIPLALAYLLPHLKDNNHCDLVINNIKEMLGINHPLRAVVVSKMIPHLAAKEKTQILQSTLEQLTIFDVEEQAKFLIVLSALLGNNEDTPKIEQIKQTLEKVPQNYGSLWQMWATIYVKLSRFSEQKITMLNQSIEVLKIFPKEAQYNLEATFLETIPYLEIEQLDQVLTLFLENLGKYQISWDDIGKQLISRWIELDHIDKAWFMIKQLNSDIRYRLTEFLVDNLKQPPPDTILEEIITEIENNRLKYTSFERLMKNLLPFLAKTNLNKALSKINELKTSPYKSEALLGIAKYQQKTERASLLMEKVIYICSVEPYSLLHSQEYIILLSHVVPMLPRRLRSKTIKKFSEKLKNLSYPYDVDETYKQVLEDVQGYLEQLSSDEQNTMYQAILDNYLASPKNNGNLVGEAIFSKLVNHASEDQLQKLLSKQFSSETANNEYYQTRLFARALIETAKRGSVSTALEMVKDMPNSFDWKRTTLINLSFYVDASLEEKIFSIIENDLAPHSRIEPLSYLTYNLKNVNLLEKILDFTVRLGYAPYRAKILEKIFKPIEKINPEDRYPIWKKVLEKSIKRPRSEVLSDLTALFLSIAKLGGKETLQEAFTATVDVSRWWE
jgi:hypothetical protein